KLLPSRLSI
ncbi:chlamydia polymorphic membrane middle domain protein, partial [Chlamydia psittaci 02DC21]